MNDPARHGAPRWPKLAALAGFAGLIWWRARPQKGQPSEPRWEPQALARLAEWHPQRPATPAGRWGVRIWAAPMTALGLLAAATTGAQVERTDDGLVVTGAGGPCAAELRRRGFTAATLGQVIIAVGDPSPALLAHERVHVRQAERLGPMFGPVYVGLLLVYGYRRHPMERAARRGAAQPQSGGEG